MQREVAELAALAMDAQVFHAAVLEDVQDGEAGCLLAAKAVLEQHGEQGAITPSFYGVYVWCLEQRLGLVIAERRVLALVAVLAGPLHAVHGVAAGDGVALQQEVDAGLGRLIFQLGK